MKSRLSILSIMLLTSVVSAQSQEVPKKEFIVTLSTSAVSLNPGDKAVVELTTLRSKAYQKGEAKFGLSTTLPDGLSVSFDPEATTGNMVKITIESTSSLKPGTYTIIVNCTLNYKTKGSTLKITVP